MTEYPTCIRQGSSDDGMVTMGPTQFCERPTSVDLVSEVRQLIALLPDVRQDSVARARASLAAGLPSADDIARSMLDAVATDRSLRLR